MKICPNLPFRRQHTVPASNIGTIPVALRNRYAQLIAENTSLKAATPNQPLGGNVFPIGTLSPTFILACANFCWQEFTTSLFLLELQDRYLTTDGSLPAHFLPAGL